MSNEAHCVQKCILKLNKLASLSYILLVDYIKMYVQKFQSFVIGLNIRVNRPSNLNVRIFFVLFCWFLRYFN